MVPLLSAGANSIDNQHMTILITGASKGLGQYLYQQFSSEGFHVLGTYNSTSNGSFDQSYTQVDVSSYTQVQEWVASIQDQLNQIVLINCAGISYNAFTHKSNADNWHRVIDVNLKGSYNTIQNLLPIMRSQGYGRIINFSSVVAKLPTLGTSAYTASKLALSGLSKTVAAENANKGITVNTISPGYFNIGMGINDVPDAYREKVMQQIPMKRFGEPSEIYRTVQYIIDSPYLTGSDIDINGGLI